MEQLTPILLICFGVVAFWGIFSFILATIGINYDKTLTEADNKNFTAETISQLRQRVIVFNGKGDYSLAKKILDNLQWQLIMLFQKNSKVTIFSAWMRLTIEVFLLRIFSKNY